MIIQGQVINKILYIKQTVTKMSKVNETTFNYQLEQTTNKKRSSPSQPTFRKTPSPNKVYKGKLPQASSYLKAELEHPSTEQYTPLAISPSQLLSIRTPDDIDQLIVEHRYEVETLLLEIGRLQEQLNQAHRLREIQIRKTKQESEETSHLRISQIQQNQQGQAEVFELQIRKLKAQLAEKTAESQKLTTQLQRQKQSNERETKKFKEEVRLLIQKKNSELYELKQSEDNRMRDFQYERNNEIQEIKYTCDRQMSALVKQLEKQREEIQKLKNFNESQDKEKQKIINYLEKQRDSVERRYEQRFIEQEKKYENIRSKFTELINQFSEDSQKSRAELQQLFETQYSQLLNLVNTLQKENNQIRKQIDSEVIGFKIQKQAFTEENQYLKQRIKEISENSLTDMELLKVKLAALHQNDLKNLKDLYQMKLKHSGNALIRLDQQNSKLREFINLLSSEKYEQKKKYDITVSQLNSKIMKMRMGISSMENEFKQKLENEKSVLLMTSRSFLKEAQVKTTNNKFLEEEIRKLRQLMELQGRQNQNDEKALEEKILAANDQLQRLSNKVLIVAKEKQDIEAELKEVREEKDKQIKALKEQINAVVIPEVGIVEELKIIEDLKGQLNLKKEEISLLNDRIQAFESRIKEMQAESERLQMENNMNTEELKSEFHGVAESHLASFKEYYQEKLKRVEDQKGQLKKVVSSQYQQITELIKKYKQTEEDLKEAVKMMKKRTELEEKVMNIGLDTNLVRNMVQLLPNRKAL